MARRPARFRQSDVVRAIRAARAAGIKAAVELVDPSGHTIRIIERPEEVPQNPFDQWKANRNARQAQRS